MKYKARGFTIVELLIVIVVIAILATIGVVLWRGASQRAQNIETLANLRQVLGAIKMYQSEHDAPPLRGVATFGGTYSGGRYVPPGTSMCIGTGYEGGLCGAQREPGGNDISRMIPEDPSFCEALLDYISCPLSPVAGSGRKVSTEITVGGQPQLVDFRNAFYMYQYDDRDIPSNAGFYYGFGYYLLGDVDCGLTADLINRTYLQSGGGVTVCAVYWFSEGVDGWSRL